MGQNSVPQCVHVMSPNQKATEAFCSAFLLGGITTSLSLYEEYANVFWTTRGP